MSGIFPDSEFDATTFWHLWSKSSFSPQIKSDENDAWSLVGCLNMIWLAAPPAALLASRSFPNSEVFFRAIFLAFFPPASFVSYSIVWAALAAASYQSALLNIQTPRLKSTHPRASSLVPKILIQLLVSKRRHVLWLSEDSWLYNCKSEEADVWNLTWGTIQMNLLTKWISIDILTNSF